MKYLCGIDGFKKQWVAVTKEISSGNLEWKVLPDLEAIIQNIKDYCVIAIDIPIGLTESGPRMCDMEARKILGNRRSSVFPSPIMPVLLAESYTEACQIRESIENKRMSKQSWAIVYKIKEIKNLVDKHPDFSEKVFEVHPEVSFYLLADNQPAIYKKKSNQGKEERASKLSNHFGISMDYIRNVKSELKAPLDDILDAFVALWSAERIYRSCHKVLPKANEGDGTKFQKIYG